MIKIAFFDVDGTLLQLGSKEPSPKTVQALQKLRARIPCSSKTHWMLTTSIEFCKI